jgi:PAS domain S-box-containing protein
MPSFKRKVRTQQLQRTFHVQATPTTFKHSESLRPRQVYFEQLFYNTSDGIVILDDKNCIVDINSAFTTLFGYQLKEIRGKDINDIIVPLDLTREGHWLTRQTHQREKSYLETVRLHKNGQHIPVAITGVPIFEKKKQIGAYGIYRDITVWKQAETALRENKRRITTLMRHLPGMAYRCRPDKTLSIEFASEGAFDLTGYRASQLIDGSVTTLEALTHPDDWPIVNKKLRKAIRTHAPFCMIYRITTASGVLKWVWEKGQGVYSAKGKLLSFEGFVSDITDRVEAEEKIAASKKLMDDVLQGSPVATYVIDMSHKVVYWNKALEMLTGRNADEMIGTSKHWQVFYAKKRSMVVDYIVDGYSATKVLQHYKTMNIAKNKQGNEIVGSVYFSHFYGGGRWLRFRIKPLYDLNGNRIGAIETVEDIHDRMLMEQALKERIYELRVLYQINLHTRMAHPLKRVLSDIAKDLILTLRFVEVACARITFDGKSYRSCKHDCSFVFRLNEPIIIHNEKRGNIEIGYSKLLPSMSKKPFIKEEEQLLKSVAATLSRHIDSREVFERYQKLLNKVSIGVFILSEGRFRYANPRLCKIFKLKAIDILDRHYNDLVLNCTSPFHTKPVNRCEATGKCGDGTRIRLEIISQNIAYYGKQGVLGTIQDVTKLKLAEERLIDFNKALQLKVTEKTRHLKLANQRLQSLNVLKDEFIAVTSHELRSPLTSIRGYLSFLKEDDVMACISAESRQHLERAYNQVETLNTLVNNILDVSHLESGRFLLKKSSVDLVALIRIIIDSLAIEAQKKKVIIVFNNLTPHSHFRVYIDSIRMRQVMVNLIENAIKFSSRGKTVTIELRQDNGFFEIQVRDSGVGIPKSQLGIIFDKFMQIKSAPARHKSGAGLGLFITKHIVELHGGTIDVKSQPRVGTTFLIRMPLSQ